MVFPGEKMIKARIEYGTRECEDCLEKVYVIAAGLHEAGFEHSFVCGRLPEKGPGFVELFYGANDTAPNQDELEAIINGLNIRGVEARVEVATPLEAR